MSIKAANNVFPHDPDDNWRSKTDKGGCELTAQQIVDRIDEIEAPDDILVRGDVIKTGNVMSIAALAFTCRINQQVLTNPDEFETTIAIATEGYKRIDILVFTKFATIVKIQGIESVDAAEEPPTPPDTIKISFVSVFGSVIDEPEVPDMNGYITKVSKSFIRMYYTGHIDSVPVDDKSYLKFEPGMLSLKSLQIANTNFLYHGREFIIKNGTAGYVTLFHLQGTGNFRFSLPNALDLIIKPEESVLFVMRAINSAGNGGLLDLVGIVPDMKKSIISNPTISYTFKLSDATNGLINHSSTSAITEVIPNDSTVNFPIGTVIESVATGTGIRTTSGAVGVTVQTNVPLASQQNEIRRFIKIDTNKWLIEGNEKKTSETFILKDTHYAAAVATANWFFKVYTNALVNTDSGSTNLLTAISGSVHNYMSSFDAPFNCEIISITVSIENDWTYSGSFGFAKHKKNRAGAGAVTNPEVIHEFAFTKGSFCQYYKKITAADFGLKTVSEGESIIWGWKGELRYAKILLELKKI